MMRRLRFPVQLCDDESIPGALACGIRENVLGRSLVSFEDTGLPYRSPGLSQVMAPKELERLAEFLGCDPAALIAQGGQIEGTATSYLRVRFGDLVVERSYLDLHARRVGPISLGENPHHRMAWLYSILPYCPLSLEKLVSTCPACGVRLGWSLCWGIGVCEHCSEPIAPSPEDPLPIQFAGDYRLFAGLLSPQAEVRAQAASQLPAMVQGIAPGSLVQTVMRLGMLCRDDPIVNLRRQCFTLLDPALLGSIISWGTSLLRSWPDGFTQWAANEFERREHDLEGYHQVRKRIRRLGNPDKEDVDQVRLVRTAMPSEFASFVRSLPKGSFYTATEAKQRTSINHAQLDALRSELEDRRLPGRERKRSQFSPERVEEFGRKYRTSLRLRKLTFKFRLPTYALEQFCCVGLLTPEDDAAVRIARHGICVPSTSVEDLVADLKKGAKSGDPPTGTVPLCVAACRIGGREKPWGLIFEALRAKDLDFWLNGDEVTTRTIHVWSASMARFDPVVFSRDVAAAFPFSDFVKKVEAQEILNITPRQMASVIDAKLLKFGPLGNGLIVSKRDVLLAATKLVSTAELGALRGLPPQRARAEAAELGVRPIACGWSRSHLFDLGLIPGQPTLSHS